MDPTSPAPTTAILEVLLGAYLVLVLEKRRRCAVMACERFRVGLMGADGRCEKAGGWLVEAEAAARAMLWRWWVATLLDLGRMVNITQILTALAGF